MSNRGCPYKCTYCFNHAYNKLTKGTGDMMRYRSVDSIIREIKEVKDIHEKKVNITLRQVFPTQINEIKKDIMSLLFNLEKDNLTSMNNIINTFNGNVDSIVQASNMQEAVKQSYSLASKGDVVLLSPACASFDLFENYEDRGHQFKQAVRAL